MKDNITNILLLTAKPRTGKSTCIKKIVNLLGKENCEGFYTKEIKDDVTGERTGFMIETLSGEEVLLASTFLDSKLRISKYGVNIEAFEKILKLLDNLGNYNAKIKRKKIKSQKYINELERFSLDELKITINSEHGVRKIEYNKDKKFSCTCDFYKEFATCSHIMAVESLINRLKNN